LKGEDKGSPFFSPSKKGGKGSPFFSPLEGVKDKGGDKMDCRVKQRHAGLDPVTVMTGGGRFWVWFN